LTFVSILLWAAYAYVQGTIGFGLFVVGHECGHGAFSSNQFLNDIVGFILHSAILVPYFSWQRSHHVHHSKNSHLLDNESHQPSLITKSRNQYETTYKLFGYNGFIIL
jgi:fatty acid desaturase